MGGRSSSSSSSTSSMGGTSPQGRPFQGTMPTQAQAQLPQQWQDRVGEAQRAFQGAQDRFQGTMPQQWQDRAQGIQNRLGEAQGNLQDRIGEAQERFSSLPLEGSPWLDEARRAQLEEMLGTQGPQGLSQLRSRFIQPAQAFAASARSYAPGAPPITTGKNPAGTGQAPSSLTGPTTGISATAAPASAEAASENQVQERGDKTPVPQKPNQFLSEVIRRGYGRT